MYANSLTSNSMNTQALAEAYITLINRIPGFENELNEFYDLSDGHIFSRLLVEIDKTSFKRIDKVKDTFWIQKVNNLKKIHSWLSIFVEKHQERLKNFSLNPIDLHSIAREKQITDLVRFCQAIFYVLFFFSENCPGLKLEFVTSNLPKSYQDLIARATNEITHNNNNANNAQNVNPKNPFNNGSSNKQIEAIKLDYEKEIEELKKGYDRYFEEVQFLKNNLDETQTECKSLKQKLNDYEASLLKAGENSKTEHILKQEIDELRASLTFAEQKRHEAEMTISRQNADMAEQSRQIHTLNEKAQLADQLNEERREHRLLKDKLQRVENTNEKYKKSFEELVDYKKRFKSIKEENLMLLEDKTKLQRDIEKLTEFKVMSETYKEQVLNMDSRINTLNLENERNQFETRNLKENIRILEMERDRYQEEAMNFESKLKDIELGITNSGDNSLPSGGISLDEAEAEDLKSKVLKLEQELTAMRNGTRESGSTQRIIILENMLEDAKKARNKVEEELMESHRKNLLLEEELKRLNPSESGDKLSYDLSLNLRLRLSEAEEEASKLKRKLAETEIALEQANNELLIAKTDLSMVGKDQLEAIELVKQETTKLNEKFISEKQEISEKCEKLEEEARKQMQFVNQLLMDKDSLKTQSLQQKDMLLENEKTIGQLKATLTTLENQGPTGADKDELSKVKEMLVAETNRNMELREENVRLKGLEENLNLKISLLTEQIKSSERQAKDTSHAGQEMFGEALSSLKSDLRSKEEDLEKLKHQLLETQKQHRLEATFMSSAWHDLGLRVIRDRSTVNNSSNNRQPTNSWLAVQRNNLNVQLKRR